MWKGRVINTAKGGRVTGTDHPTGLSLQQLKADICMMLGDPLGGRGGIRKGPHSDHRGCVQHPSTIWNCLPAFSVGRSLFFFSISVITMHLALSCCFEILGSECCPGLGTGGALLVLNI